MNLTSEARADLTALSDPDWYARIDDIGEEAGYFESLGPFHSAFFSDEGSVLLVTFETRATIRANQKRPSADGLCDRQYARLVEPDDHRRP